MKSVTYEFECQEEASEVKYIIEAFVDFDTNKIVLKPNEAFRKNKNNTYERIPFPLSRKVNSFKDLNPEISTMCKSIQEDYFEKIILANTNWSKIDDEVKETNLPRIKELWCR